LHDGTFVVHLEEGGEIFVVKKSSNFQKSEIWGVKIVEGDKVCLQVNPADIKFEITSKLTKDEGADEDADEDTDKDTDIKLATSGFYFGEVEEVLKNGLYLVTLEGTNGGKVVIDMEANLKTTGVKLLKGDRVFIKDTSFGLVITKKLETYKKNLRSVD